MLARLIHLQSLTDHAGELTQCLRLLHDEQDTVAIVARGSVDDIVIERIALRAGHAGKAEQVEKFGGHRPIFARPIVHGEVAERLPRTNSVRLLGEHIALSLLWYPGSF